MVRLLLIIVLVLALLANWSVRGGYNKIRSADVRVAEALSGIDVELTRRASLIPEPGARRLSISPRTRRASSTTPPTRAPHCASATGGKSVTQRSAGREGSGHRDRTAAGARPELSAAQLLEQLPESAGQPRRHREQAGLRASVLQRRRVHPQRVDQHHPVDVLVDRSLTGVPEREYYQTPR